jgi:ABC-type nickel/cobalt efflux system permease component RcnA
MVPSVVRLGAVAILVSTLLSILVPAVAFAHPLGNFTINRYSRLEIQPTQVRVRYVLDMAEIPTYQELGTIHSRQGDPTDAEKLAYLAARVQSIKSQLDLTINGHQVDLTLEPGSGSLTFPPGQGGLPLLRLTAWYDAALPSDGLSAGYKVHFADKNYADRLGWKEIVVTASNGAQVSTGTTTNVDQSKELTNYPNDMLSSPLNVTAVDFAVNLSGGAAAQGNAVLVTLPRGQNTGFFNAATVAFTDLINRPVLSIPFILFALVAASLLGGAHALAPGHGKTIVAAYLVGARGTPRHALILGLTVTATHTLGVFALGFITLFASRFVLPEQLYPWLSAISGAMVMVIGAWLLAVRFRAARRNAPAHSNVHTHVSTHAHPHSHDFAAEHHAHAEHHDHHDHEHEHGQVFEHDHGAGSHTHVLPMGGKMDIRGLLGLGISGGLLPCPSALVVLLAAIGFHRVAFGVVLVCAFSLGLAGVLTGIGLLLVYARGFVTRFRAPSNLYRYLPAVSAFVVLLLGVAITVQALAQTGLVTI